MLSPDQIKVLARKIDKYSMPEPNSGCWLWLGALSDAGYGITNVDQQNVFAHRASYLVRFGSIPAGLHLDHLCRVRCCCNPDHLEPVTIAENLRRGVGQLPHEFCRRGHPLINANIVHDNARVRRCAICSREKNNAYYRRRSRA